MLGTILVVVLILLLVGALPRWGHSVNWGYAPSAGLGICQRRTKIAPVAGAKVRHLAVSGRSKTAPLCLI